MDISVLLLISTILGQAQEVKKDVFLSANHLNFNLNKCFINSVSNHEKTRVERKKVNLRIKYSCKTLLHLESSMECKSTYIDNSKLIQQPSFKPKWMKGIRKLVDNNKDFSRIIYWDEKGSVIEKVILHDQGNISNSEERTCYGRAF